jgi:hypothetical protein
MVSDLPYWKVGTIMTLSAESSAGIQIRNLSPGSFLDVETKNRHYKIECLGGNSVQISGHPQYCPKPILAELAGSVDRDGVYETGTIKPGMHLLFMPGNKYPVTTSRILRVRELCGDVVTGDGNGDRADAKAER